MTSPIKLAAFDLGNVIVGVQEQIPAQKLASLCGKPVEQVLDVIFSPGKKALFESGRMSWEEHAANAIHELELPITEPELRSIYHESLIPDQRVIDIVSKVAEQVQITIASNTSQPHWEWVQQNLPFASRFEPPILSHLVKAMKPDAAFYRPLIERSGYKPGEIFFTDDRQDNIEGAKAVGIQAFLFTGADQLEQDLRSCGIAVGGSKYHSRFPG